MDDTQLTQISRYIERARHDLLSNGNDDTGALLFMGEMQDPIPRTLIIDQTLNAIDVRVWMLLRISIANPVLPGKLPSQKEVSDLLQCSESTVWISMQVLRLNRWLTLCERVNDHNQMNRGNIYALHSEPMAISDTLRLDAGYLDFIEQSLNAKTKRIKNNAMAVHIDFYKQIHSNEPSFNRTQLDQHNARYEALQCQHIVDNTQQLTENELNYYAHNLSQTENQSNFNEFERDQSKSSPDIENRGREKVTDIENRGREKVTGIENRGRGKITGIENRGRGKITGIENQGRKEMAQPGHFAPALKIEVGKRSGSSNIYNTKRLSNTTTTTRDQVKNLKSLDRLEKMILAAEIPILHGILNSIEESVRQDVLDQILGRLVNYQKTGHGQIYNLVSFSQALMIRANEGLFTMDSNGLMIQNGRKAVSVQENDAVKHPAPQLEKVVSPEGHQRGLEALRDLKAKMKINR